MAKIRLLDVDVEVAFKVGTKPAAPMNEAAITASAIEMADLIETHRKNLSPEYRSAYQSLNKIVFFEGTVTVNGRKLSRPGMDQDDAIFYWQATEFARGLNAGYRGNTLFHDCWHIVQYKQSGYPKGKAAEVDREVDAVFHQIAVARVLGCSEYEIEHLIKYAADPERVKARLKEGVS